jgi:hypothetical protein
LADPECDSLPPLSTNARYLIAVWNEVLTAPPSVVAISKIFPEEERIRPRRRPHDKAASKPTGVKVDVVADDGRRWVRVNTSVFPNKRVLSADSDFLFALLSVSKILGFLPSFVKLIRI